MKLRGQKLTKLECARQENDPYLKEGGGGRKSPLLKTLSGKRAKQINQKQRGKKSYIIMGGKGGGFYRDLVWRKLEKHEEGLAISQLRRIAKGRNYHQPKKTFRTSL